VSNSRHPSISQLTLTTVVQRKTQLGGNKYIYQVTLWMSSDGDVQIMFWVKDAPQGQKNRRDLTQVVHRSQDGKNVIREHRIFAKL
jgi:hypothetical protein